MCTYIKKEEGHETPPFTKQSTRTHSKAPAPLHSDTHTKKREERSETMPHENQKEIQLVPPLPLPLLHIGYFTRFALFSLPFG